MPWYFKKLVIIIVLFGSFLSVKASHIVGGYFSYACNGAINADSVEYDLTLRLYLDCDPTSFPGDPSSFISIFNSNGVLVFNDTILLVSVDTLPDDINNPCVVQSPNVCVKEQIFKGKIRLLRSRGHTITYQRCCRNASIDNLFAPDQQGSTFTIDIPSFNLVGCNTSPSFNSFPPISLCAGFDINLDLSATDLDGDSLVYSICSPFNYSSLGVPSPVPASPPPYSGLPFLFPQTASNPIPSNPQITINSSTGRLRGTPTSLGQYVAGFCIEEYRNGVLLSITRRGLQINTGNCSPVINTAVQDQELFCDGLTVKFKNSSTSNVNVKDYKWDFGVLSLSNDTSRLFEPTFTYPDTGIYTITLVANPDYFCRDSSTKEFHVYQKLSPLLETQGKACLQNNNLVFVAKGDYESYASFLWNFGPNSNISTSNLDSVPNVIFTGTGPFPIQLIVSQDECSDTINQTLELFENPVANFNFQPNSGCYPLEVSFNNTSTFEGQAIFNWDFGDGGASNLPSPLYTYRRNGYFDVSLELITTNKCKDTVSIKIDSAIHTSLDSSKNKILFDFFPKSACLGTTIKFSDSSVYQGSADYYWDLGNNDLRTEKDPIYVYPDTGYYSIGLLLITKDTCIDTLNLTIDSAIRVLPQPIAGISVIETDKPLKEAYFDLNGLGSQFYSSSEFYINGQFVGNGPEFKYHPTDTGHFKVMHIVSNGYECKDTVYAELFVYDQFEFLIPNVFSPNGDAVNDLFEIRACGVYDFEIEIYNRYGAKVFASNAINIAWDGRVEGIKANAGAYFYKIRIKDFRGQYLNYSGSLTLLLD